MIPENEPKKRRSMPELFLVAVFLFCCAYVQHILIFPNPATRLDLTHAVVFQGTLNIDAYHSNTMDKAYVRGHYYCDKAPGLSFAAAPAMIALKMLFRSMTFDPGNPLIAYMLTFLTVSIPCALALILLYRMLLWFSDSRAAALFFSLATGLGTIFLTYASQFYGHAPAASLCVAALYLITDNLRRGEPLKLSNALLAGLLCGCAIATDYLVVVHAAVLFVLYIVLTRRMGPVLLFALGAALPLAALAAYNNAAFGSPISLGYLHEVDPVFREGIGRGVGGVALPNPLTALKLLFSPQRGLFWGAPFLLAAIPGFFFALKKHEPRRAVAVACGLIFLGTLAIAAAYYAPFGGYGPGPRFLVPALPFLSLLAAAAWPAMGAAARTAMAALAGVAVLNNLFVNMIEPHAPEAFAAPALRFCLPLLRNGYVDANLGNMFNLSGIASFAPLALILCGLLWVFDKKYVSDEHPRRARFLAFPLCALFAGIFVFTGLRSGGPAPAESARYFSDIWMRRGIVEFRSGRAADSERSLRRAIDADPAYLQPYLTLGASWLDASPQKAVPLLRAARRIARDKNDPAVDLADELLCEALIQRASDELRLGKPGAAEQGLRSAVRAQPGRARPHIALAGFLLNIKNSPDQALRVLREGRRAAANPLDPDIGVLNAMIRDIESEINAKSGGHGK